MSSKLFGTVAVIFLVFFLSREGVEISHIQEEGGGLQGREFRWKTGPPFLQAANVGGEDWISVKDPTVVRHRNRWHLFYTLRGRQRSHAIGYVSFSEFCDAPAAEQTVLQCHNGFFCAPQVFYFTPHKKWYLICQASDKSWNPEYQAAYTTTTDISDPRSWSPLQPLGTQPADGKSGLDFWIICDEAKAHLFFTTLDGRMWREESLLKNFPKGWSLPTLALQGDIFEASHTYRLIGSNTYLTLVEAQGGHGWRYFKAYAADRLEGEWKPLAAEKERAFASMQNVHQVGERWTDCISHGELIRSGSDQRLRVNPVGLKFLFQGVTDREREGKKYGEIPWRLGILE
jgi:hypothetical protein